MCGRFTNRLTWQQIHDLYDLTSGDFRPNLRPRFNAAPTQKLPAVRLDEGGRRILSLMRWGFERDWAKHSLINARAETVATSRAFRPAFERRRCLVPADGFFEWGNVGGARQPFWIVPAGGEPFSFAGIWEVWRADKDGPDYAAGEVMEAFCIITTAANAKLAPIHDRMPVILDWESWGAWLDGAAGTEVLAPYPAERVEVHPVSRRVNNVRNDDESVLERAG